MIWVYIGTHLLTVAAGFVLGAWWSTRYHPAPGPVVTSSTWDGARWSSSGGTITSVWDALRGVKR